MVVPVFNESENLPRAARLTAVLAATGLRHEIVFVDDGSRDGSLGLLQRYAAADPRVLVVELARNFRPPGRDQCRARPRASA